MGHVGESCMKSHQSSAILFVSIFPSVFVTRTAAVRRLKENRVIAGNPMASAIPHRKPKIEISRSIPHLIEWKIDQVFENIRKSQTSFNVESGNLSDWLHLQSKKIGLANLCKRDRQILCLL